MVDIDAEPGTRQVVQALIEKLEEEHLFQTYAKNLQEITINLTAIDDLNEFFRQVVIAGRERLGFERLAMFLWDADTSTAHGTFGTDRYGNLTDERHISFEPPKNGAMWRAYHQTERFSFDEDALLLDNQLGFDRGWNAASVLWDGEHGLGWLVADNALRHTPASKPLLDALGLYSLAVGALLARKRSEVALRDSEARYRLLAENVTDVIARVAPDGYVIDISVSCVAVLGYKPEELIGQEALLLVHEEDADLVRMTLAVASRQPIPTMRYSYRVRHKDGRYVWLETIGQIIRHPETGRVLEFVLSSRDITERKRAEDMLRHALEQERELNILKSRFVSMASHEFRTPLANILSASELLAKYRSRMTDAQVNEKLNRIGSQVVHLNGIIDDVLNLTRAQTGRLEFASAEVDIDALCREIIGSFRADAEITQTINYFSDRSPFVIVGDKRLLRRIIGNLLSNAVKFSPPDAPIIVHLEASGRTALLSVQDRGIGIPEADRKRLFEPFFRASNAEMIAGTGLGLALAKQAVEAHDGRISVLSALGEGTTFTVELPIS